ncbi:hypothetical protein [Mycobacteroides abscessus]|uniref:hypothetical protein n=1 Tax=Mycobacteroides abscessus TaxID=36809 RepID=UPI0012FFDC6D|nr:hypothetical protein [Mycobacteroides abscessus]
MTAQWPVVDACPVREPWGELSREQIQAQVGPMLDEKFRVYSGYLRFSETMGDGPGVSVGPSKSRHVFPEIRSSRQLQRTVMDISTKTQKALQTGFHLQLGTVITAWDRWCQGGPWDLQLAPEQPYPWPEFEARTFQFEPARPLTFHETVMPIDGILRSQAMLSKSMRGYADKALVAADIAANQAGEGDIFDALRLTVVDYVSASASVARYCAAMTDWVSAIVAFTVTQYESTRLWGEPIFGYRDCPKGDYWTKTQ